MPKAWNNKDERQYEHVKQSARERGSSEDRAEEIAARVVNRTRREEGITPSKTTQGTGNPNSALEERSVKELRNIASDLEIDGRSKMKKAKLIEAIRAKR